MSKTLPISKTLPMSKTLATLVTALLLPLIVAADLGCATSFTGSPQYPGGPAACFRNCAAQRMRMAQYVYVGAYSSACVCEIIPAGGGIAAVESSDGLAGASGGTSAAAVGVMTAMRERERQRQSQR